MSAPIPGSTRRQALGWAGLTVGGLGLAACSSSTSAASSPSSTATTAASSGPAVIVALSAVPVGQAVSASLGGKPIIVAQPAAGQAVAFSAICTHQGCTVAPKGSELDCPCHGSKYNALTGAVINGPAPSPLPPVSVTVQNGNVVSA